MAAASISCRRPSTGRAYGLGIADDKHGIAVILHALTMLKALLIRAA